MYLLTMYNFLAFLNISRHTPLAVFYTYLLLRLGCTYRRQYQIEPTIDLRGSVYKKSYYRFTPIKLSKSKSTRCVGYNNPLCHQVWAVKQSLCRCKNMWTFSLNRDRIKNVIGFILIKSWRCGCWSIYTAFQFQSA